MLRLPFNIFNRINGVMVSVLASSAVDRGFKPKTIKLVFVAKHAALRKKSKDWLTWKQNNVSECSGLLFQ
jgi:hypothetical protein